MAFPFASRPLRGDKTDLYRACVDWLWEENCTTDGQFPAHNPAPPALRLTRWSCVDNCRYECMWITVEAFQENGLPIPQFHGKWPFVRWHGVQEPASALFSLLNFAAHLLMGALFARRVPSEAPMYGVWVAYTLFSLNAWMSSTIFHIKDTPVTEKMDYFGALAYILSSLFAVIARYLGPDGRPHLKLAGAALSIFFVCHVSYLSFVEFNYSYNLLVNVGIGGINSLAWLVWCAPRCRRQPHNRKAVMAVGALTLLVGLEVLDFPPLWWTFDAHALWHGGTVLLAVPWYLFVVEDCLLQMMLRKELFVKEQHMMFRKKV